MQDQLARRERREPPDRLVLREQRVKQASLERLGQLESLALPERQGPQVRPAELAQLARPAKLGRRVRPE